MKKYLILTILFLLGKPLMAQVTFEKSLDGIYPYFSLAHASTVQQTSDSGYIVAGEIFYRLHDTSSVKFIKQ
jgi:hypothetical protein